MTGLLHTHVLIYGFNCMLSLGRVTSESHNHQAWRETAFENQPLAFEADVASRNISFSRVLLKAFLTSIELAGAHQ